MVKPKNRSRRRRQMNRVHREQYCYIGQLSPATTASIGYGQLIAYLQARPFTFRRITITAAALDVATANKLTIGPAHFQIRQLAPIPQISTTTVVKDSSMIKASKAFMVGTNPRTFRFNLNKFRYPSSCKLDAFIAIDCICPAAGYEIGIQYSLTLEIDIYHEFESESCPKVSVTTTDLFNTTVLNR